MAHRQLRRRRDRSPSISESSSSSTASSSALLNLHSPTNTRFRRKQRPPPPLYTARSLSFCSLCCFGFGSLAAMAEAGRSEVVAPSLRPRKIAATTQQKRAELEQEVAELQKMLEQEQQVNAVLQSALHESSGAIPHIPSFLPPKMKELLAELSMVEGEIARLEGEITHLKTNIKQEQQQQQQQQQQQAEAKVANSKQWHQTSNNLTSQEPSMASPRLILTPRADNVRHPSQTRGMYFINQAIKGDYPLNNNGYIRNERIDHIMGDEGLHERVPRKSGLMEVRSASTSRVPPPKPLKSKALDHQQDPEISYKMLLSSLGDSTPLEESSHKWQPNKLSESIMKCLICIFLRLIRTTRIMEIEKSGVISRSSFSSSSSRSFRSENSTLGTKSGPVLPRDHSPQQDPYGVFDADESVVRDIGPYKNYVRCTSSSLDVKSISSCVPLLRKLRVLMGKLHDVDLRFLTYQQKLAFWINMYNACIMHGFLQLGLPSSAEKTLSLMNKAVLSIGGNKLNALAIERFILRQPSNLKEVRWKGEKEDKEDIVRSIYGLEHPDPNVTFALSCGSRSSPAVRIYTADGVCSEVEKAKLEYLQASIVVKSTKRLMLPRLLLEFAKDRESLVEWVCDQLPTSWSLRKSIVECCRGQSSGKMRDVVEIMPFEYDFQYLLAV